MSMGNIATLVLIFVSMVMAQQKPKPIVCATNDSLMHVGVGDTSAAVVCGSALLMCTSQAKMRTLLEGNKAFGYFTTKLDTAVSTLNLSLSRNKSCDSSVYYSKMATGLTQQAYDTLKLSLAKADTIDSKLRKIQALDSTRVKMCEDSKTSYMQQALYLFGAFAVGFISSVILLKL